ncbi:MAG TPA: signal peptide peptidase SppA [Bryobacteraceae bacterium]|nr:signal peptide peptidase SppA [Bryobacteraceae bacterium]
MWKFVLGIAVGIVVAVVGSFIILYAIGRAFSGKQPTIAGDSVLVLALDGDLPEAPSVEIPVPFLQAQTSPTVRDVWTALRGAASDNRIKAIVLQPRGIGAGWGKLQELRQQLTNFKKSGKPVYAYLQSPGSREYYLASVADRIFVSPDDMLGVKGFLLQELYFKNTLDKFGVSVQVDHIGKYKDAGDLFTKTNMSPETREVLNQVLDQLYGEFCAAVGQSRHKSADEVRNLVDAGPFLASQAKADGLIDELGYEDDVYGSLKKKLGLRDLNKTNIKTYFRAVPGKGDRIALLAGEGDIVRGDPDDGTLGGQAAFSASAFSKVVRQVRNDSSVKGVILRVDSPGGDSVASDEILHELKLLSAAKPLVISMSDMAASGGYFISMTGDPVLSYPNTITGSIGVLYIRPNLRGLLDKLGVQIETLARGKMAGIDSVTEPLSDAAQQKLHDSILATYRSFVGKVASARKKNFSQIDALAQGRVWMGTQARQNGLVDDLGGLDQAIALIRKKANLSASGETNLVLYPARRSLFEILSNASPDTFESSAVESRIRKQLPGLPSRALLEGGMLRILPYRLTVQ